MTLEIFTSVLVAYRCPEMGTVSTASAVRAMYIVVMLFFLTAVIGVGCQAHWRDRTWERFLYYSGLPSHPAHA